MSDSGFPRALSEARQSLEKLLREKQKLDVKIAKMEQVVAALRSVADHDDDHDVVPTGFSDAIRGVLKGSSDHALSPMQIREGMLAMGFDLSRYNQPLASIHVVLKRLEKSGEALPIGGADGKRYWWTLNGAPPRGADQQKADRHSGRRKIEKKE
jgi:hypothetical protein